MSINEFISASRDENLTIAQWCVSEKVSRTQLHYLGIIGRAPKMIVLGGRKLISPEARAQWRRDMEASPIRGSVRRQAERVLAEARSA